MSAYQYVLFPRGKQPSMEEIRELTAHDAVLARRYAWGKDSREGRLVVAFDQTVYEYALATDAAFRKLIGRWTDRGCELADHLAFIKDGTALKPTHGAASARSASTPTIPEAVSGHPPRADRIAAAKELAAHEAIANSRLAVAKTLAHFDAVQRLGAKTPYVLMAIAAAALLITGWSVMGKLEKSDAERRQETIHRVLEDPMSESLAGGESK